MTHSGKVINHPCDRVQEVFKIAAYQVGRAAEVNAAEFLRRMREDGDIASPIEHMYLAGLLAVAKNNLFTTCVLKTRFVLHKPVPDVKKQAEEVHQGMLICLPQAVVGNYVADFIIYTHGKGQLSPTVVELDGHQWHERSEKERRREKERDRFMQSLGFRVGRYTGSEVFKDPFKVAADSLELMVGGGAKAIMAEDW